MTNLLEYRFVKERKSLLPYSFAKSRGVLPLDEEEGELLVATSDPLNLEALEEVRFLTGKEIREIAAAQNAIEEALEKCYQQSEKAASELIAQLHTEAPSMTFSDEEGDDLLAQTSDAPVIRMLNAMILEAVQQGASDIHFEPLENGLGVRYRIDGILQPRHAPPKEFQPQLITRIKVMARLDIAEQRLPQDGRIKLRLGGRQIDFRVSTVPVAYGERIVLRILDKGNVLLGLSKLGMRPEMLETFQGLIHLSEGMILVTGPTGSGKTTTLYSVLSEIQSSDINIMTIEDPVEYKLPGLAQIGVNPKIALDFSRGLRHILRQDPDAIMIGEIRDRETAEIAIQAALTGHLVFSTLHTNDAPSAITRLVDMGIEPYLLSSSMIGVLAQRLVRAICPHCKKSYSPSHAEISELGIEGSDLLYRGEGCLDCFHTGYKGRHALYELMVAGSSLKRHIATSADAEYLKTKARDQGMLTLREEGALLAIQGVTTASEVLRVARSSEDL